MKQIMDLISYTVNIINLSLSKQNKRIVNVVKVYIHKDIFI